MIKWWLRQSRWVRFVVVLAGIGVLMVHPITRIPVLFIIPVGPGINEFVLIAGLSLVGGTFIIKALIDYLTGRRGKLFGRNRNDSAKLYTLIMTDVKWYLEKHPEDIEMFNEAYLCASGQDIIQTDISRRAELYTHRHKRGN